MRKDCFELVTETTLVVWVPFDVFEDTLIMEDDPCTYREVSFATLLDLRERIDENEWDIGGGRIEEFYANLSHRTLSVGRGTPVRMVKS